MQSSHPEPLSPQHCLRNQARQHTKLPVEPQDIRRCAHLRVFCCDVTLLVVRVNFFLQMVELACKAGLQLQVIQNSAITCCSSQTFTGQQPLDNHSGINLDFVKFTHMTAAQQHAQQRAIAHLSSARNCRTWGSHSSTPDPRRATQTQGRPRS